MVDYWSLGLPAQDSHLECILDQLGLQVLRHRPAGDGAREDVGHPAQVKEALAGADVLDVSDPDLVRAAGHEVAFDQVRRRLGFQ